MASTTYTPGLTPAQVNRAEPAQWRQLARQTAVDIRTASPAFLVEDMDPVTQTVTVQIAIQERVRPASGAAEWWDIPPIIMVPVLTPRGGGFAVTLPLKKGDEGLLIFCDTCFDNWWVHGQSNAPPAANVSVASGSQRQFEVRRHHVHDCGFMPGMWSQPNVLPSYSTDSLQIRTDDGVTTVIDVSQDGVSVKGAAVTAANGGTALALVNANFYAWFVSTYMPSVVYITSPPPLPAGPETIVLKGE